MLNDAVCFKAVYIVCGYTDLRSGIEYVNACPLYRQEKEFERYGIKVSRQNMAYWTIQCADRYLAVLYDYLHKKCTVITHYRRMKHLSW